MTCIQVDLERLFSGLPQRSDSTKARSLSKAERSTLAKRKQRKDPSKDRAGKPVMVSSRLDAVKLRAGNRTYIRDLNGRFAKSGNRSINTGSQADPALEKRREFADRKHQPKVDDLKSKLDKLYTKKIDRLVAAGLKNPNSSAIDDTISDLKMDISVLSGTLGDRSSLKDANAKSPEGRLLAQVGVRVKDREFLIKNLSDYQLQSLEAAVTKLESKFAEYDNHPEVRQRRKRESNEIDNHYRKLIREERTLKLNQKRSTAGYQVDLLERQIQALSTQKRKLSKSDREGRQKLENLIQRAHNNQRAWHHAALLVGEAASGTENYRKQLRLAYDRVKSRYNIDSDNKLYFFEGKQGKHRTGIIASTESAARKKCRRSCDRVYKRRKLKPSEEKTASKGGWVRGTASGGAAGSDRHIAGVGPKLSKDR